LYSNAIYFYANIEGEMFIFARIYLLGMLCPANLSIVI
jgi:hypothetical protein